MPETTFAASVRPGGGIVAIDLKGDMNGLADAALNAAYQEATRLTGKDVLLNFEAVDYINSTGIALIVGLLAQARKERRKVLVCGLSEHYREIFSITRLADFMSIFPDEASALAGADASAGS